MKHHGKSEDAAILKLLDSAYTEIEEIESAYRMQVGGTDLRAPIEYYQDVARLISSGKQGKEHRLSVENLSRDINHLRQYGEWLSGGGHVFLDQRHYDKALQLKRHLIGNYTKLDIDAGNLFKEVLEFAQNHKPHGGDYDALQDSLVRRIAEKEYRDRDGNMRFVHYPAKEFWQELEEAMRLFGDSEKKREGSLEFRAGGKTIKKIKHDKTGEEDEKILGITTNRLKYFWVQVTHPLLLASCLAGSGDRLMFDPARFISEQQWQVMEHDAKRLSDLYRTYTVLFAAMVRDTVDKDFKELVESKDALVEEASDIKQIIQQLMNEGVLEAIDVEQIAGQCQNEELKKIITMFLEHLKKLKQQKVASQEATQFTKQLDEVMKSADTAISAADKAHFNFLAGQLMVYQSSTDLVKKLASQGLNLAGKFVETAAAEVSRGSRTRGR